MKGAEENLPRQEPEIMTETVRDSLVVTGILTRNEPLVRLITV